AKRSGTAGLPAARHAVFLRPLLRGAGHVDCRRDLVERLVPRRARRTARKAECRRLLGRRHRYALRDRHGLHHSSDPQQLSADLAEMNALLLFLPALMAAASPAPFLLSPVEGQPARGSIERLGGAWELRLVGAERTFKSGEWT